MRRSSCSIYETGPLVLLEAMPCGTPVISTRVGIAMDAMKHDVNGLFIPKRNPEMLARTITILWEDSALQKKLGQNARMTVEKHYTWSKMADRVEECYQQMQEIAR
ncbi:MAG: glycosyltransferase family 4 protein [archaeon]|nr:glycosyltransferase family 4 protein [archaeon]